jgi:predicted nucleotidyltransferase
MRPSLALSSKLPAVRAIARRYRVTNLRVFGSASQGTDSETSDLDLLVDPLPGVTLFDLGGLQDELQTLLGIDVDLLTPGDLRPSIRSRVLAEAKPVARSIGRAPGVDA